MKNAWKNMVMASVMVGAMLGASTAWAVACAPAAAASATIRLGHLTGQVRTAGLDVPVPAVVDLWNQDTGEFVDSVSTDHQGNFEFIDIRPGTYKVVATTEFGEEGSEEVIFTLRGGDIHVTIYVQ